MMLLVVDGCSFFIKIVMKWNEYVRENYHSTQKSLSSAGKPSSKKDVYAALSSSFGGNKTKKQKTTHQASVPAPETAPSAAQNTPTGPKPTGLVSRAENNRMTLAGNFNLATVYKTFGTFANKQ